MPRSRSARAHEEVLKAALALITDHGIDVTSVDAIAEASGVSKATIYRHSRTKEEICLEALSKVDGDFLVFDSDDPRSDLVELLRYVARARKPETLGKLWPRIVGYAVGNPAFGAALRARFDEPRHEQVSRLITRAIFRGKLRRDLDLNSAPDMLLGPIMYRRLQNSVVPPDLPEKVVDTFWKANALAADRLAAAGFLSRRDAQKLIAKANSTPIP
jgi:AcrR family transcriptional regulator